MLKSKVLGVAVVLIVSAALIKASARRSMVRCPGDMMQCRCGALRCGTMRCDAIRYKMFPLP